MSLPLVVSAMKMHSMQIKNIRERCMHEVYLKKYDLHNNYPEPNLKSSKARLHNRRRSTRKKVKKKSTPKVVPVDDNDSKAKESEINNASCYKNKKNQEKPNTRTSTKSRSNTKNQATSNPKDLDNSSSVIICSVRKLISSYSTKNVATLPRNVWKKTKISPRPQTSSGKKAREMETSEIKIKRQSCPPPLFQPVESPVSKNVKLKKVYYSEAQSRMLSGVPCVPPTTPFNDCIVAVEMIPCLADIKSQQAVKTKLRCLVTQRQRANEKIREKVLKEEKRKEREQIECLKQQRRAEIYALNEVMTAHERNKFLQFMKERNNGATKISLKV